MRVADIANVGSGLVVSRKKAMHQSEVIKIYKQLNLMAVNKNGYIDFDELEDLPVKDYIDYNNLTHKGDIVVRLTAPFTAVYITEKFENIVISSNFCVVRCKENYCNEFLSYFINSDKARKAIFSNLQGSIMKNINISAITELEVPDISIAKQIALGKLMSVQTEKLIVLEKLKELQIKLQKVLIDSFSNE